MSDTQEMEISDRLMKWIPWIFAGAVVLLYMPHLLLGDIPLRDVAGRYAPMAEAFARGDYLYAFHPRVQTLHPLTAGLFVRLTGMSGFMGAKCSALLFYALCAFPLFFLLKRVYSRRVAVGGMFLYLFASRIMIYVYPGLREPLKCFVLLMLALSSVIAMQERSSLKGYLLAGAAAGLGVMVRSELILFSGMVMLFLCVLDWCGNRRPWRTLAGSAAALLLALPEVLVNYFVSGYAAANIRFGYWYEAFFGVRPGVLNFLLLGFLPAVVLLLLGGWCLSFLVRRGWKWRVLLLMLFLLLIPPVLILRKGGFCCTEKMTVTFIKSLLLGTFPAAAIAALVSVLYRAFRRLWRPEETFLLLFYFLHGFFMIYQIILSDRYLYVSARYLLPVSMVLFGWSVSAVILAWSFVRNLLPRPVVLVFGWILFLAGCIGFYADGSAGLIRAYTKNTRLAYRKSLREISSRISSDYRGSRYYLPVRDGADYLSPCRPTVYFDSDALDIYTVAAYLAGGSAVSDLEHADYAVFSQGIVPAGFSETGSLIQVKNGRVSVWKRR